MTILIKPNFCYFTTTPTYENNDVISMGYMGDNGQAYTTYGYRYNDLLVPFLSYCVSKSSSFDGFNPYISLGSGNPQLINNTGLGLLLMDRATATATADYFLWCQRQFFFDNIWTPIDNWFNTQVPPSQDASVMIAPTEVKTVISAIACIEGSPFTIAKDTLWAMVQEYINTATQPQDPQAISAGYWAGYNYVRYALTGYNWLDLWNWAEGTSTPPTNNLLILPYTEPPVPSPPTPPTPPVPPTPTGKSSFWHLWFDLGVYRNNNIF